MTTPAETIAQAIRDGFHEIATAVQGRDTAETPTIAPGAPDSPSREESDGEPPTEAPQGAIERAATVLERWEIDPDPETGATWTDAAQALADAGLLAGVTDDDCYPCLNYCDDERTEHLCARLATPRPMTVGQLGAQHIGKRVTVERDDGPTSLTPDFIAHRSPGVTTIRQGGICPHWTSDTPCTVEN